jgi:hypothetical protein
MPIVPNTLEEEAKGPPEFKASLDNSETCLKKINE